jgi:hypothetical protein
MDEITIIVGVVASAVTICLIVAVFSISHFAKKSADELAAIRQLLSVQAKSQNGHRSLVDNQVAMPQEL